VRDGVTIPESKVWLIIVPVWKNCRDKNEEEPEEKEEQWHAQSEIQLKGGGGPRPDTITEAMECS
jgi:hypothetical protein